MIQLTKDKLHIIKNAAQVGLSKVSHLTDPNTALLYRHAAVCIAVIHLFFIYP